MTRAFLITFALLLLAPMSAHAKEIDSDGGKIDPDALARYQAPARYCYEYARLACEYVSARGYDCHQVAYAYIDAAGKVTAHMLAVWKQDGAWCYASNNVMTCGMNFFEIIPRDLRIRGGLRVCNYEIRPGNNTNPDMIEWCKVQEQ